MLRTALLLVIPAALWAQPAVSDLLEAKTLDQLRRYDARFDARVFEAITPEAAVAAKRTPQSTGPGAVAAALAETGRWIQQRRDDGQPR